jgi:hypothetical protein
MENEEKILKGYTEGQATGEDNKLTAAVGLLSSKRTKELVAAIDGLHQIADRVSTNLMINLGHHVGNLNSGIEKQVQNLNGGIEQQVRNVIASNESLGSSNERYAEKMQKFTKVNIWLTTVIAVTGIIGLWNIILTNQIKDESIRANQINEQPLLIFTDFSEKPYKISNSGKGVATNFLMVLWDKNGKQLYMTPESGVGEALAVNMSIFIDPSSLIKTDFTQASKVPVIDKVIKNAQQKNTSWFAIVYEDIYGNPYATLVRGQGGDYTENVRFIRLNKD